MSGRIFNNSYAGQLQEIAYQAIPVSRDDLRTYIDSTNYNAEQKTSVMTLIRNEGSSDSTGKYKFGINNNFGGIQADVDKWPRKWEPHFVGVVHEHDRNGDYRWFIAFDTWQSCVDFMLERTKDRGIYVGGYAKVYAKTIIDSVDTFITAYYQEWVRGEHILSKPIPSDEYSDLLKIYKQEYKYFSESIQKKNRQIQQYLGTFVARSNYNIHFFLFGK